MRYTSKFPEVIRQRLLKEPEAFQLDRRGSDLVSKWRVRSEKYNIREDFVEFVVQTDMTVLNAYRQLVHGGDWPIAIDGDTVYPVPFEETGAEDRGPIRRTIRRLPGKWLDVIRKRLGLSSDAEAVRVAVEKIGRKLVE